jgi:threonine synthase
LSALAERSGLAAVRCPRCGYQAADSNQPLYRGCPVCAQAGLAVNFVCETATTGLPAALADQTPLRSGLWRFASALPVDLQFAVSLGEGDTPLLQLPRLGGNYGLRELYVKNESANPTWSHKDRLVAVTVAAARQAGATVVTAASTGNHGASLAAYAARAGLRCLIVTLASVPETMKTLMQSYGALVVATETSAGRYDVMTAGIDQYGWYPASNSVMPPVGSSPYGVDGYKTIAYELFQQFVGSLPEWIIVPVAYGDCLSGIYRGLCDLRAAGLCERLPKLVGAEVFGPLRRALEGGDGLGPVDTAPTAAFSIGGAYTTEQAIAAIRGSAGVACTVSEEELVQAQKDLASSEGLFAEAASCVALAAARQLRASHAIAAGERVVGILTSSGLKDPSGAAARLPDVPTIEPTLDALRDAAPQLGASSSALAALFGSRDITQ